MVVSFPINNIHVVHKSRAECYSFRVTVSFTDVALSIIIANCLDHPRLLLCLSMTLVKFSISFVRHINKDPVMLQSSMTQVCYIFLTSKIDHVHNHMHIMYTHNVGSLKGWLAFLTILDIAMIILSLFSVVLIFTTLKRAIKLGRVSTKSI